MNRALLAPRSLLLLAVVLCAAAAPLSHAHTVSEWKSRAVYQLLTDRFATSDGSSPGCDLQSYCGGTWKGIQAHLDYIQNLGFDAIWITPIVENIDGGYHGYWLKNLYNVNSHFGSAQDLKNLVNAAHARGMWIMLDVVANHVGPVDMDFAQITPFNQTAHYHSKCQITDWNNQPQVEVCRLANLPDLDQSNSFVADTLCNWIRDTVNNFGFDGIRIDTVPEVSKTFWPRFAQCAGTYQLGEVFNGNVQYVASYQQVLDGVFSYPLFFTIRNVFGSRGSMRQFEDMFMNQYKNYKDPMALGVSFNNHDNPRFLSFQGDSELYKSGFTFILTCQGIPVLYYGSEQGFRGGNDPQNREPLWTAHYDQSNLYYKHIQTIMRARAKYQWATAPQVQRYADDSFYAYTRGNVFVAVTNAGSNGGTVQRNITYHPYASGQRLCNIFNSADVQTVSSSGFIVTLMGGESKIYVMC